MAQPGTKKACPTRASVANSSRTEARRTEATRLAAWLAPLVLLVTTVAVLWPVCTHEFLDWDDYENVAQNPDLNPLTVHSLLQFWQKPYQELYVPVTYSFWALLSLGARLNTPDADTGIPFDPYVFHSANLLVHLVTVLIAYLLLKALCGRRWPALGGAMLFAIHPLQVEPVAWVTGMKDLLCGMFSLLALWQYVLFARPKPEQPEGKIHRNLHYAVGTAAFVLALLSKPSAVTIPLAAAALDYFLLRRRWRQIALALVPWCALSLAGAFVAHFGQTAPAVDPGFWSRPVLAAYALCDYVWKFVFPLRLGVFYQTPREILSTHWAFFAVLLPLVACVALWIVRRRAPWLVAAAIIFAAGLLPVLGLVPFEFERYSLVADRYVYVSMLGPALALTFALMFKPGARIIASVCVIWLVLLAWRANQQTDVWRDAVTLFQHETEVNPASDVAYAKLAIEADHAGHTDQAIRLAKKSISQQQNQAAAYVTLGSILLRQGRNDEAQAMFEDACQAVPPDPLAMVDLAGLLAQKGELTRAADLCRRALAIDPDAAITHTDMAMVLANQHHYAEALEHARTAVRLEPSNPQMHLTLASLLRDTHQPEAAEHEFQIAAQLSSRKR